MHRVDPDPVPGVLHRGRLGHEAHRALRGVVGHVDLVLADESRDRRDVHDRAAADLLHGGDGVLHAEEDALGVHVHEGVPGHRAHGVGIERAADPRVVHQDVQLPESSDGGLDRLPPVRLAGDVELHEPRLAPGAGDLLGHLATFDLEDVADDDFCAFPGEDRRLAQAHAAGAARDERHLPRESHTPSFTIDS